MILLIDDNPDDIALITAMLEKLPGPEFASTHAELLADGLTILEARHPDMVLLDLELPDAHGLEGLARVVRAAPDLPIVVVTGKQDEELAVEAVKAGAQDYLVKDELTVPRLLRVLRQSRERHRRLHDVGAALHVQQHRATHDELTGLPNRTLFRDRLVHALDRATRERQRLALVHVDLDGLRLVNDTLGHGAGDELLIQFAAHLQDALRRSDTIARLGGDEFGILLEDIRNRRGVVDMIEQARAAAGEPIPVHGQPCAINFSAGIAIFPEDGLDPDKLLSSADVALHRDKGDRRRANRAAAWESIRSRRGGTARER